MIGSDTSAPLGVNRAWYAWVDSSRGNRELAVLLYYPVLRDTVRRVPVIPGEEWRQAYLPLLERKLGTPAARMLIDAEIDLGRQHRPAGDDARPVLLFGPGLNWLPTDYTVLIHYLVLQGYIIAAIAPVPVSPLAFRPGGEPVQGAPGTRDKYELVAQDFLFTIRRLQRINMDTAGVFYRRLDMNRVGVFGHSLSGAAAFLAAGLDTTIHAAANLDGDLMEKSASAQPKQPILYLTTNPPNLAGVPVDQWPEDRSEARRNRQFESAGALSETAVRIRTPDMLHLNFVDAAVLPLDCIPDNKRKNRFGSIDGKTGARLVSESLTLFFDMHLKNKKAAWDGFQKHFPAVVLNTTR